MAVRVERMLRNGTDLNWKLTEKQFTPVLREFPETPCSDMANLRQTILLGHDRSRNKTVPYMGPNNTYGTRAGLFVQSPNDAYHLSSGADIGSAFSICHVDFIVSHTSDPASVTNLRKIFRPDKFYSSTCPGLLATGVRAYARFFVCGQMATRLLPAPGNRSQYTSRRVTLNEKHLQIFCKTRKIGNFARTTRTVAVIRIMQFVYFPLSPVRLRSIVAKNSVLRVNAGCPGAI